MQYFKLSTLPANHMRSHTAIQHHQRRLPRPTPSGPPATTLPNSTPHQPTPTPPLPGPNHPPTHQPQPPCSSYPDANPTPHCTHPYPTRTSHPQPTRPPPGATTNTPRIPTTPWQHRRSGHCPVPTCSSWQWPLRNTTVTRQTHPLRPKGTIHLHLCHPETPDICPRRETIHLQIHVEHQQ